jgi:hypothetical protein
MTLRLKQKIEKMIKVDKTLKNVPGPSPWYLRSLGPKLKGYKWIDAGDTHDTSGKVLLKDSENVYMIVDFYNYISLLNREYLLIWHQSNPNKDSTSPVNIKVIRIKELKAISGDICQKCRQMKEDKLPVLFNSPVVAESNLSTISESEYIKHSFPEPISEINEILILCHSSGIKSNADLNNVGLMIVEPKKKRFIIHPQDWFNHSACDFGYQWITRVGRDKKTGAVFGDGIRISAFELDSSMRNIKKTFL